MAGPDEIAATAPLSTADPISGNIHRLAALQRIARTLPLASPLDQFYVTSPHGKRRDPFTKTWAYHAGLDLGAPRNSKVLATAPGRVVVAGPSGPYGKMIEIDHGLGILTRYGHLDVDRRGRRRRGRVPSGARRGGQYRAQHLAPPAL